MKKEIYLLLDNVRSLYNVGSIFRTAEACGIDRIFLTGISGVERFGETIKLHHKLKKTALEGLRTPWEYAEDPIQIVTELKNKRVQIVSLEQRKNSTLYSKAEYQFPLCLVVGHETHGVGDEINSLADLIIEIPMVGKGKSLNVSVATAVALFNLLNLPRK